MLPVTGLPPQITVQSTPAFALSPVGIMLNFSVLAKASETTGPVTPAALVREIGPAFASPDVALLPQPASMEPSAVAQIAPHKKLAFRRLAPERRPDIGDSTRVSIGNIRNDSYFFSLRVASR
jgi:hypothetical protein